MPSLEFNVVYTPGSVKYLSLFVWSLLENSDACFRLVSNGCLPIENQHLLAMCRREARLEFHAIPAKASLPHGQALNYLHALTRTEHFCFLDSDIFATGDFLGRAVPSLADHVAVFSGSPLWIEPAGDVLPAGFPNVNGEFNRTDKGLCLGCTYFAIYDHGALADVMHSTGVGFEEARWAEIPEAERREIRALSLERASYDTGKVVNLLLASRGHRMVNLDIPDLWHVGGTSFQVLYDRQPPTLRKRLSLLADALGLKKLMVWRARPFRSGAPPSETDRYLTERQRHRDPVREYALTVLDALFRAKPVPPPPATDSALIDQRVAEARDHIVDLFFRHGPESARARGAGTR